jgi:hypothetical protein
MSSGNFEAALFETAKQSPASLIPAAIGAGNVGVCLSGGGSRAFSAGLGQLRALETIQLNGSSLLSQVSILSTVSGGGWIGIPFVYLPGSFNDASFLGPYVPPNGLTLAGLLASPSGIGAEITSGFSIAAIALTALSLHLTDGVPWDMAWQTVMGLTFLQPFGLFAPAPNDVPTSLFSYDTNSLTKYVTGPNPSLTDTPTSLVAQVAGQRRPYLVSMASLAVGTATQPNNGWLAPVQSTPILTGVLSTPPGAFDINGRPVGGGGTPSFAFNSAPVSADADSVTVQQTRQWSLTDILGTSSAAYSETLIEHFNSWKKWPVQFAAELRTHKAEVLQKLSRLPGDVSRHAAMLNLMDPMMGGLATGGMTTAEAMASLPTGPLELDPFYQYWSPVNPPAGETVNSSFFADGGNLENTGVASMLTYSNITSIIAFVNVDTALSQGTGNSIVVDSSLPSLFGFQAYSASVLNGYAPIAGYTGPFQFSQVFPSTAFAELQQGLWKASGSGKHSGAAIFEQQLTTVANPWFGVPGGQQVTVLWVYLNYASDWYQAITDVLVKGAVDLDVTLFHFPNYSTLKTDLTPLQVHLLSNFASWVVQDPSNVANFTKMF